MRLESSDIALLVASDYFLHPLNPFRTSANTGNEVLAMQGIGIGMLMQQGTGINAGEALSPAAAEEEYSTALSRLMGEQYELMPPSDAVEYMMPSPLYTIRHVLRTTTSSVKVLGIYYVVEGVIYKSPAVLSLMKANVTRTLEGLSGACSALSVCARYQPSLGYTWVFEDGDDKNDKDNVDPVALIQLSKKRKRRKILDNRRPGERTAAEEEGIRASEAMNQILVRISKSPALTGKPKPKSIIPTKSAASSLSSTTTAKKGLLPQAKEATRK
jgi:hypothetical protein